MTVPLEQVEAEWFVQWLQRNNIDHWHIIQENIVSNPGYWAKLKRMGWNKGTSDYLIYLPVERCKFEKAVLLWIELKRQHNTLKSGKKGKSPSTIYPEQLEFVRKMNTVDSVQARICYGAKEAEDFVTYYCK